MNPPPPKRDKRPNCPSDEQLVRIVIATANQAVDILSRTATAHKEELPEVSGHVHELSRAIAGMTLDALRTWPKPGG